MQTDRKPNATKRRIFDAIIIVPLEEEFETVLNQFVFVEDLTNDTHIRFAASVAGCQESFLLVKQTEMGRTENAEATTICLAEFDTNLLICVGIAAGLSKDVAIGDVCYTGTIVDVLDNAKITQLPSGKQQITLSPTFYSTPRALVTPIALDRIHPATKPAHLEWATEQGKAARTLIPNEFSGRTGKRECVKERIVREGVIACGLVSDSTEYHCRPVKQAVSADKGMILGAILAN
jgi:Phosphorylase superfamily